MAPPLRDDRRRQVAAVVFDAARVGAGVVEVGRVSHVVFADPPHRHLLVLVELARVVRRRVVVDAAVQHQKLAELGRRWCREDVADVFLRVLS